MQIHAFAAMPGWPITKFGPSDHGCEKFVTAVLEALVGRLMEGEALLWMQLFER